MVGVARTHRRTLGALALWVALAGPVWPQDIEPAAAPGSIAIGLIENADAEGVFEIVHNGQVSVRHPRSGLVCHFLRDGAGARLVLFPGLPRGEDVACDTTDGRESVTLYATRFPGPTTLQEQIAGAENALRTRFPDAEAYTPALATDEAGPPSRTIEFIVARQDGARMYTRACVSIISGWVIKMRYTYLAPDAASARSGERMSSALWTSTLAEVMTNPID